MKRKQKQKPHELPMDIVSRAALALAKATLLVETSMTPHTGACRSLRFVAKTKCKRCQEIDLQREALELFRIAFGGRKGK